MNILLRFIATPIIYLCFPICMCLRGRQIERRNKQSCGESGPRGPRPRIIPRKPFSIVNSDIEDQSLSPLLSKLPPELRFMIWKLCIGGNRIHITGPHYKKYMHGTVCRLQDLNNASIEYHNDGLCGREDRQADTNGLLSLAMTCRKMSVPTAKE